MVRRWWVSLSEPPGAGALTGRERPTVGDALVASRSECMHIAGRPQGSGTGDHKGRPYSGHDVL